MNLNFSQFFARAFFSVVGMLAFVAPTLAQDNIQSPVYDKPETWAMCPYPELAVDTTYESRFVVAVRFNEETLLHPGSNLTFIDAKNSGSMMINHTTQASASNLSAGKTLIVSVMSSWDRGDGMKSGLVISFKHPGIHSITLHSMAHSFKLSKRKNGLSIRKVHAIADIDFWCWERSQIPPFQWDKSEETTEP